MNQPQLSDFQKIGILVMQYHNIEVFKKLVDQMDSVNKPFLEGYPLIHMAIDYGFSDGVKYLLEKGCNPNLIAPNGKTPLCYAAHKKDALLCEELIKKGADVNKITYDETTPLLEAVFSNSLEVANILLANKANPNFKYGKEEYPLICGAIATKNIDMLNLLVKSGANVNAAGNIGQTALHVAASTGYVEGIATLLNEFGANINAKDINGQTPLHIATLCNQINSVVNLLHYKADALSTNNDGKTCLDLAIENKNPFLFQLLYDSAINNHPTPDKKFDKILFTAAKHNDRDAIVYLSECIENINYQNEDGDTALHLAARNKSLATIEALVHFKADINIQNNEGKSPINILKESNEEELINFAMNKFITIQAQQKSKLSDIIKANKAQDNRQKD